MVTMEARPESLAVDPQRAAVIVIDMQNDFGAPGGMFERAGLISVGSQQQLTPPDRF